MAWRTGYVTRFGNHPIDLAVALLGIFGAVLAVYGTLQHSAIAEFLPTQPDMVPFCFGISGFFLTTIAFTGICRTIGASARMGAASGFLLAHIMICWLTYTNALVIQAYLSVFGMLGVLYAAVAGLARFRLVTALWVLVGLSFIPILWVTFAWLMFALPHANFLNGFLADHIVGQVIIDFLHQRAYVQMVHEFGVPSVGINGLGYHNYHWLIAYPLSTLAKAAGMDVLKVHANILPGFTGPVLVHGLALGVFLVANRASTVIASLVLFVSSYVLGVLFYKAISYGLIFLTPSTAYSMALAAPAMGVMLWIYLGNQSQVRAWHFLLFGGFVVIVGLAKITTLFQTSLMLGFIWFPFVLRKKGHLNIKTFGTLSLALTVIVSLFLVWEISKHERTEPASPPTYVTAFGNLSQVEQDAIEVDVADALSLQFTPVNADSTSYENIRFSTTVSGFTVVAFTVVLVILIGALKFRVRHWLQRAAILMSFSSASFVVLTVIFGYGTPTQTLYILLPCLYVGLLGLGHLIGAQANKGFLANMQPKNGLGLIPSLVALICVVVALIVFTPRFDRNLKGAVAATTNQTINLLANAQGRNILIGLAISKTGTFPGISPNTDQINLERYWRLWEERSPHKIASRLELAKASSPKPVAVFIPALDDYWTYGAGTDSRSPMFWIQGTTGIPLYRGKINPFGEFRKGFRGRGISDFGDASASLILMEKNVFCWARFEGFTIINIEGEPILEC